MNKLLESQCTEPTELHWCVVMFQQELNVISSVTYINKPRKRRCTPFRQRTLAHTFFRKIETLELSFEEFSVEWLQKP